jgi:uncharacterized protein with HEPN domain
VTEDRSRDRLALAIEHLQNGVEYSRRGRAVFFEDSDPDTRRLVEGELRKAFESLKRLGDGFYHANPTLDRERIGAIRQLLTHDYSDVEPEQLWRMVSIEAPRLLRRLARAQLPA